MLDSPQFNAGTEQPRTWVPYMNLGGGMNTKEDAHALRRDQLAFSSNAWYGFGNSIGKRPGNAAVVTNTGATGSGHVGTNIYCARFNDITYFLVQQGTALYFAKLTDVAFTAISTALGSANQIQCAQMFDPSTGKDTVFICNGVDQPWMWTGPTSTVLTHAAVPKNFSNTAFITPRYVTTLGNNSKLFYSGEPTAPSAVFPSDAMFPQSFTTALTSTTPYTGVDTGGVNVFAPAIIGNNDGVEGGIITGIRGLGSAMIVYKESAIYRMDETQLLGDTAFRVSLVSGNVGCLSPFSIVNFGAYHTFLAIDGYYATDGTNAETGTSTWCISADVPTYFDSTLTGFAAIIKNRTTMVAGRMGNRALVWFDDGSGAPTRGLWFDFNHPAATGNPTVGEINGMNVAGCAPQRGPGDDGTLIWIDGSRDRVARFGLGFGDFGNPVTVTFFLKADMFEDVFGNVAPICVKDPFAVAALVALPNLQQNESLTIQAALVTDLLNQSLNSMGISAGVSGGGQWGQNWGQMQWSQTGSSSQFQTALIQAQSLNTSQGKTVQIGISETSTFPVVFLGVMLLVNRQEPPQ